MTTIEQMEIKGLTVKQGFVYVVGIISIVAAIVLGYSNIINYLEKNKDGNEVLKMQFETLRIDQKAIKENQNTNEIRLRILEVQVQDLIDKKNNK